MAGGTDSGGLRGVPAKRHSPIVVSLPIFGTRVRVLQHSMYAALCTETAQSLAVFGTRVQALPHSMHAGLCTETAQSLAVFGTRARVLPHSMHAALCIETALSLPGPALQR